MELLDPSEAEEADACFQAALLQLVSAHQRQVESLQLGIDALTMQLQEACARLGPTAMKLQPVKTLPRLQGPAPEFESWGNLGGNAGQAQADGATSQTQFSRGTDNADEQRPLKGDEGTTVKQTPSNSSSDRCTLAVRAHSEEAEGASANDDTKPERLTASYYGLQSDAQQAQGTIENGASAFKRASLAEIGDVVAKEQSIVRRALLRFLKYFRRDLVMQNRSSVFHASEAESKVRTASVVGWRDLLEIGTALAIAANSATIGIQTDEMARSLQESDRVWYIVLEWIYCFIFTTELAVRIGIHRCKFFYMQGRGWNFFDSSLVVCQWIDVVGISVAGTVGNVSFLRLWRILRLLRVLRMVRVFEYIGELNVVAAAIVDSMKSLMGTLVLIMLVIYAVGIMFTQIVCAHRINVKAERKEEDPGLNEWWGNVGRSCLSLFQAVLGGVDWGDPLAPIMTWSHLLALIFLGYIAFVVLAMLNVITGIFVESAIKNAESTREKTFLHHIRTIFHRLDRNHDGRITREEYVEQCQTELVKVLLKDIGIDPKEAIELFDVLDDDGSGAINAEELLKGVVRLRSGAKFMDLKVLARESMQSQRNFEVWSRRLDQKVGEILEACDKAAATRCLPQIENEAAPSTSGRTSTRAPRRSSRSRRGARSSMAKSASMPLREPPPSFGA